MSYGLIAVIIVIGIVIGAIATKKCEPFLIGGSIIGAIFLYKQDFITEWVNTLEGVMSDEAYLILVCGLFGSIIALLTASKGHFGFAKIVSKICNSERKTLFTTFILGVIIFIDDYLNVLSIGTAMKKVYDKVKVPREALAYLLDSTGSPVCVMFPFSSWAAYFGAIFFAQESVQALGAKTWMGAYIKAIPFCIYPIVALLIVILFSAGVFPKLGGMKKAYERVATTGKVYSDASKKYNMDDGEGEQDGNIFNFLVPMLVLVVVACVTGNLVVAQIICLAVTLVMYLAEKLMTFTEYWDNFVKGFADMLPIYNSPYSSTYIPDDCKPDADDRVLHRYYTANIISKDFPNACIYHYWYISIYDSQCVGRMYTCCTSSSSTWCKCRSQCNTYNGSNSFRLCIW